MSVRAYDVMTRAKAGQLMLATAESCTGGGVAEALTALPGSSDVFERGFVTYSNAAKRDMLGVTDQSLEAYGAVSESVAWEMAEGALHRSQAQVAVSVTGIAGPGGSEWKPEGRVCFGLAAEGLETQVSTVDFGALGRTAVRAAAVDHALGLLADGLRTLAPLPEDSQTSDDVADLPELPSTD